MATGPINYLAAMPQDDFLSGLAGGLKFGAGLRQMQSEAEAQQFRLQQQQQMQSDLSALAANPAATGRDYAAMMTRYPALSENLKRAWDAQSADQQQGSLSTLAQVTAALHAGRPEVGAQVMRDQATALRNSGDVQGAKTMEDMARLSELDPDVARMQAGLMAAAIPGGDKILNGLTGMRAEQRAAELQPFKRRQEEAGARKAESEATIKGVEAGAAPEQQRLDLLKLGADIGLTKAQTTQALKQTEKLGAEVQKLAVEASGAGGLDPEKRFDFESKLRKEYSSQTSGFQEMKEAWERINASQDNAVGDLSLIFGYMKMLDPGSVVREGEFATAQNAAGVPERLLNIYNKVRSGERLSAGQRSAFRGQAKGLLDGAAKREKTVRDGIDQVVKSYRLNPDNVFYEPGEQAAPGQAAPGAVPSKYQGRKWTQY